MATAVSMNGSAEAVRRYAGARRRVARGEGGTVTPRLHAGRAGA